MPSTETIDYLLAKSGITLDASDPLRERLVQLIRFSMREGKISFALNLCGVEKE